MIKRSLGATAVLVAGGVMLLAARAPAPQTPPPTEDQPVPLFRSSVDVIEIDMRVVDARGEAVTDLDASEIEVHENGVPQPVVGFSRVSIDQPAAADAAPAAAAARPVRDVATNTGQESSRVFVIVLDDLHVDHRNAGLVKRAASEFVRNHLGPHDQASIVYSSGRADAAQDFTSSRPLLLAAIEKFVGRKLRPASVERMEQYNQMFRGRGRPVFEDLRDRQDGERAFNARSALATIETVSGVLTRATGRRKAMLVFSEGIDYDLSGLRSRGRVPDPDSASQTLAATAPTGGAEVAAIGRLEVHSHSSSVLLSLQTAVGAAARGNVALYTIDPRRGDVSDSVQDLGAPVEDGALGLQPATVAQEMRDAQESLWMLAENTGGFATLTASDYGETYGRILRESSDYYLIAYSPTNTARDGTYRTVTVTIRRPGVRVLSRPGYYAPRAVTKPVSRFDAPGISAETSALVMAPLPASGLPLEVQAVALRRDRKKADVIVTLQADGRALAAAAAAGAASNALEIALMAIDSAGRVQAATGTALEVPLTGDAGRAVVEAGYRAISRLEVPPGRYQIRVAARERNNGRRGSVFADVEVPDFGARLALSGVLITSERTERIPTSIDRATNERLPVLPVVHRTFAPADELSVVVELYAPGRDPDVDLITTIHDREGRERYRGVNEVLKEDFRALRGAYVHAVSIPLRELSGELFLQLEARPGDTRGPGVVRRVAFSVAHEAATPAAASSR